MSKLTLIVATDANAGSSLSCHVHW
jgi:hypothetical protein